MALAYRIDPYGCHLWTGPTDGDGYGSTWLNGRKRKAHWAAYELATGVLQRPGLELDHTCRRRLCVNPLHLEPVTRAENQRRTNSWRRKQHEWCPQRHRLTQETRLETPEGGWVCLTCCPARTTS